jgi:hypothetical protein
MFDSPVGVVDEYQLLDQIRKKTRDLPAREALALLNPDELDFLASESRVLQSLRASYYQRSQKPEDAPDLKWWERITHRCERVSRAGSTRIWRPATLGELYSINVADVIVGEHTETCICGRYRHFWADYRIPPTRWQKPEKWPHRCTRDHLYVLRAMTLNSLCAGQPRRRQLLIEAQLILTRWKRYPGLTTARLHARRHSYRTRQRRLTQSSRT